MTPGDGLENAANDTDGPRASVARRVVLGLLTALIAVILILGTWIVIDVLRVRSALNDARTQVTDLSDQLKAEGPGGERAIAGQLGRDVDHVRTITAGWPWSLGEKLPFVGDDFQVVAEAAAAVDDVTSDGVPALTDLATQRDKGVLTVENGKVDLASIRRLIPVLSRADEVFTRGSENLREVDLDKAHGSVARGLRTLQERLDDAQEIVHRGADAAKLGPGVLGANGKRRYLLVIQNNAEIRSTGGIPGAYAELVADDGRLTLRRQGEGSSTGFLDPPPLAPTHDEQELYGGLSSNYWINTNLTPDFPRTAQLLRAIYKSEFKRDLDGVISVDPVALARVLKATGPVQITPDIALGPENVIGVLLNAVYTEFPENDDAQNEFFAAAAKKIFNAFVAGADQGGSGLLGELQAAAQEGRILVNATNPAEQALLTGTQLSGQLLTDTGSTPQLGLYYNDSTQAKLEFYLRRKTTVSADSCSSAGVQTFRIKSKLESLAPKNVVSLGHGVVGDGSGQKNGVMSMIASYYAPFGGRVTSVAVDGEKQTVNRATHEGLAVATVTLKLPPGAERTVVVTVASGPDQRRPANFRTTPGVEVTPNNVPVPTVCD